MGFFSGLFGDIESRWSLKNPPDWLVKMSGWSVDETQKTENFLTVQTCTKILAESVASLPLMIYKTAGDGRTRDRDHNLWEILHNQPNPDMTAFSFWEYMTGSLAKWGNGYAHITWTGKMEIDRLTPLNPADVEIVRGPDGGLIYKYNGDEIPSWEVFHVPGFGGNGIVGRSPIATARAAIVLGQAAETYGSKYFENGARPSMVVHYPGQLSDKDYIQVKNRWDDQHRGIENAQQTAILDNGMSIETIGIPPEDSQFLETRSFQKREIAGWFRVPPHMLADLDRATFSNIEQMSLEFVIYTLTPWLRRFEQTIQTKLINPNQVWKKTGVIGEFNVNMFLRGDTAARFAAYQSARQSGWLSVNDIRRYENLNPITDGDIYLQPLNMVPAGTNVINTDDNRQMIFADRDNEVRQAAKPAIDPAVKRHNLIGPWGRVLADVLARVYRREKNDILAEAKKAFKTRNLAEFESWLESFYESHEDFIFRQMWPTVASYAEIIRGEVIQETDKPDLVLDLESFINGFVGSMARRLTQRNLKRILAAIQTALDNGFDIFESLESMFDDWENRPSAEGYQESVRANNGLAKKIYSLAGVIALTWRSVGESCPYCEKLNGTTVEINQWFLDVGNYQPDGADRPLNVTRSVGHPPAHTGCDCVIISGGL